MRKRYFLGRLYLTLLSSLVVFSLLSAFAFAQGAQPQGPDAITIAGSGRHTNETSAVNIQAQAGNVTALVINMTRATQAWQGYYGNISGVITLDDGNNYTLYDWSLPNPSGEVYSSNFSIVTWASIYCMNVSNNRNVSGSPQNGNDVVYRINGSEIELEYGINITDRDGLNETFNDTYTSATGFRVGSTTIDNTDGCSSSHPFVDERYATSWEELLLSDNNSLVFTSLIRENSNGFQPGATDTYDFQMLVLENGHSGYETSLSNYYFFVELT